MNIVLDTNVLLVSLPSHSKYHVIYQALLNKVYNLYVSNEILTEYEEQLSVRLGFSRTDLNLRELLNLSNVFCIEPFYYWKLIAQDPDDDKFVDCSISCGADYLVTNDKHYDILKSIPFPKVKTIRAEEFLNKLVNSI